MIIKDIRSKETPFQKKSFINLSGLILLGVSLDLP